MKKNHSIKLFHPAAADCTPIVNLLQGHFQGKPVHQCVAVYGGAGGYAVLSADAAVDALLRRQGAKELRNNSLLYYALAKEAETFRFYYGNKDLMKQLELS